MLCARKGCQSLWTWRRLYGCSTGELFWIGIVFVELSNEIQVFYTMFCACMVTASFYGTGKHEANLTQEHILIAKRVGNMQAPRYSSLLTQLSTALVAMWSFVRLDLGSPQGFCLLLSLADRNTSTSCLDSVLSNVRYIGHRHRLFIRASVTVQANFILLGQKSTGPLSRLDNYYRYELAVEYFCWDVRLHSRHRTCIYSVEFKPLQAYEGCGGVYSRARLHVSTTNSLFCYKY